jgi:hypothetical protein
MAMLRVFASALQDRQPFRARLMQACHARQPTLAFTIEFTLPIATYDP